MTEPTPVYDVEPEEEQTPLPAARITPMQGADLLVIYFMRRRDVLIAELREIDRLLGRPQTVPVRER